MLYHPNSKAKRDSAKKPTKERNLRFCFNMTLILYCRRRFYEPGCVLTHKYHQRRTMQVSLIDNWFGDCNKQYFIIKDVPREMSTSPGLCVTYLCSCVCVIKINTRGSSPTAATSTIIENTIYIPAKFIDNLDLYSLVSVDESYRTYSNIGLFGLFVFF